MAGVTQLHFQIVEEINNLKIQLCYDGHIYTLNFYQYWITQRG
jgi:myosin-crossreactive antigen